MKLLRISLTGEKECHKCSRRSINLLISYSLSRPSEANSGGIPSQILVAEEPAVRNGLMT